jgi:hypothetical protein
MPSAERQWLVVSELPRHGKHCPAIVKTAHKYPFFVYSKSMVTLIGKTIIPYDSLPESHELKTAHFFNKLGYDVEFLIPLDQPNRKTPDIRMLGLEWEIKAPRGNGKHTIEHIFRKAVKQSRYIIIDLHFTKIPDAKAISQIKRLFSFVKKANKVWVIRKDKVLFALNK